MLDKKNIPSSRRGFTIVEVMIVLAIAALIVLIVFIAVPALQRNSRNTQRSNDISLIGAGVAECLNGRNGMVQFCNTNVQLAPYFDMSKLREIDQIEVDTSMPGDLTTAHLAFERRCTSDGSAATTDGAGARSVALLFNVESTAGDEVSRCQEIQ